MEKVRILEPNDEDPLEEIKITVVPDNHENKDSQENATYDKVTYFLFGIIFCLLLLNCMKFIGYWPYHVEIEIVTDPDIEITWQSIPKNLHVTHTTVAETANALVQNRR